MLALLLHASLAGPAVGAKPAQPVVAQPVFVASPPPPAPPIALPAIFSNHGCTCMASWTFDGKTYKGCEEGMPKSSRPWCMLEEEFMGKTNVRCGFTINGGYQQHTDKAKARWDYCDNPRSLPEPKEARAESPMRTEASVRSRFGTGAFVIGVGGAIAAVSLAVKRRGGARASEQPIDLL